MKFYIISLVLNALLVFIPLGYAVTQEEPKTETINVSLGDDSSLDNAGSGVSGGGSGAGQSKQPDDSNNSSKILPNKIENSAMTETSQNKTIEKKSENSNETTFLKKNSDNTSNTTKSSGNQAVSDNGSKNAVGTGSSLGTTGGTGDGSENGSKTGKNGGGITGTGGTGTNPSKGTGNDGEKNSNYACKEGKGYSVSYNPNLETPQAAERLGKKGSVTVSISFNASGSVTVHGADGGNEILQSAAKKAAQGIRVTILDSQVTKCKVSKTFNFK